MHRDPPCDTRASAIVDVWRWQLDPRLEDLRFLVSLLSDDEFDRAMRFVRERHRLRYVAGRGRLRAILGAYLDVPPQKLRFVENAFGKPYVAGIGMPALHFNLSHSDGEAVLAVSPTHEVGIDIERLKPFGENLASLFFSPAEQGALALVPAADRLCAFYRCWTRKEAFVKAVGAGLSLPLNSFDVSLDGWEKPRFLRIDGIKNPQEHWTLADLDVAPGFVGALAVKSGGTRIRLRYRAPGGDMMQCRGNDRRPPRAQTLSRASRM